MKQKIVMLDFTNQAMLLVMGDSQIHMTRDVMTWYLAFGEIILMLDQLNLKNAVRI